MQYVILKIAGREYAVDAVLVKEIGKPKKIVPVPQLPPTLLGIMQYRERVIPMINVPVLLELEEEDSFLDKELVVLQVGHAVAGILTDTVEEMKDDGSAKFGAMPFATEDDSSLFCTGVLQMDDRVVVTLDVPTVFTSLRLDKQEKVAYEDIEKQVQTEQRYSVFVLDQQQFALPIEDIKRIVPADQIDTEQQEAGLKGKLLSFNKEIPVIDCYQVFGIKEPEIDESQYLEIIERNVIIQEVDGKEYGFYVGPITQIIRVAEDKTFKLARVAVSKDNIFVAGTVLHDEQILVVNNLADILNLESVALDY